MDPIVLIRDPDQGGAIGFIPGEFDGRIAGVYLEEGTFVLISKPILRHAPDVDYFGPTVIQRPVWEKIIEDLEALAIRVSQAANLSELDDDLTFFGSVLGYPDKEEFQNDFSANSKALVEVIGELVEWLRETLKTNESVLISGV
jgi:hypothetical protein